RRRSAGGGQGGVDPGDLAGLGGHLAGPAGGGQHVDRADDSAGGPAALEPGEGRLGGAALGQSAAGRPAPAPAEHPDHQGGHHKQPAGQGGGAVAQHQPGPSGPPAAGVDLPAQPRVIEGGADAGQQHREQGGGGGDGGQRDEEGRQAHAAQEGDRQRGQ